MVEMSDIRQRPINTSVVHQGLELLFRSIDIHGMKNFGIHVGVNIKPPQRQMAEISVFCEITINASVVHQGLEWQFGGLDIHEEFWHSCKCEDLATAVANGGNVRRSPAPHQCLNGA